MSKSGTHRRKLIRPKKARLVIPKRAREKRVKTLEGKDLHGQMWQLLANQNAA